MILNRTAAVRLGGQGSRGQRTIDEWRPLMFDYLNSDYRRPLRPARDNDPTKHDAHRVWEWIIGATAILLFIALASAFVSYEPIQPPCGPSCSMNRTSWHLQSEQNTRALNLKLASNQNLRLTGKMRV
jgi:hypothetical protein